MFRVTRVPVLLVASWCCLANLSRADDEPKTAPAAAAASAEEITGWINDLRSENFAARNTAAKKLSEAGASAIKAVAAAADTTDQQIAEQCLNLLKSHLLSPDAATQEAAKAALKGLAQSKNARVAERAAQALQKPVPPAVQNAIGGIQIQFGGPVAVAQARPVFMRDKEVTEDGKTFKFTETKDGEILVKVTETIDGKEKTTEHKAANVEDLKTNHPALHEIYKKHLTGPNAPAFQLRNVGQNVVQIPNGGQNAIVVNQKISIQQTNINGQRTTKVQINDKKIDISDTNGKNIVMKVTETENGKEKSTDYKGQDLDDLKKNHPDAAKLYEQYAGNRPVIAGGVGFRIARGGVIPVPGVTPEVNPQAVEAAQKQVDAAIQKLRELGRKGDAAPEALKQANDELEAAAAKLAQAQQGQPAAQP